jgi:2-dehydropantoate 2-reductase
MRHLDILDLRFGPERVLGGQCLIGATLNDKQEIIHLNDTHELSYGERDGARSARVLAIEKVLSSGKFEGRLSQAILQDMWEKWVFLATAAGITCLMRATAGDIVAAGAADLTLALLEECSAIATREGFAPTEAARQRSRKMLTQPGSSLSASMLRDIERGAPIEADHVVGDLLRRGDKGAVSSPLLRIAYAHLKAYEARRKRESASSSTAA